MLTSRADLTLATASGVLLVLSFPNFGHPAFAWIALTPLLVALSGAPLRRAFLLGLTTGIIYFTGTLYWITRVMAVYGGLQTWVAVLVNAVDQSVWSLRNLGFPADPVPTGSTSALNNAAGPNPLADYDVVFNTANWPGTTAPTSRARLTAFFAGGGGYIGAGTGGANFLNATSSGQLPGLATTSQSGGGQSGIFYWTNTGGAASPIVGSFPAQDTAIMDPPTWFSAVPATASIDGRLLGDTTSTFASGLWRLPRDASAANAPIIVHGTSTAAGSTARITSFSLNPLYRADPEREWPAVASAAYWADQ